MPLTHVFLTNVNGKIRFSIRNMYFAFNMSLNIVVCVYNISLRFFYNV